MADKKKKDKKKKKNKNKDMYDMFKAQVSAQKDVEETKPKAHFDPDGASDPGPPSHARTTTEDILQMLAKTWNKDDSKSESSSTTTTESDFDDTESVNGTFIHYLNQYLGNDYKEHKRSWSSMQVSNKAGGGLFSKKKKEKAVENHSHSRSMSLYSLSHERTRKESMHLINLTQKIESAQSAEEYQLFLIILNDDIKKLEQFLKNDIDLNVLWSFLDIILFKIIKYCGNMATKEIYFLIFKYLSENKRKLLKNECIRQYIQFLANSNESNPISSLFDSLLSFEDRKKDLITANQIILTWQYVASKGYKKVHEIDVNSKSANFYDPIRCDFSYKSCTINKIIIRKVFNSANKPLLLDIHCSDNVMSSVVLKKGDDLRKDKALMNIFKFMNYIWLKEFKKGKNCEYGLSYRKQIVKILTFHVVSINNNFGIIELVANCIPLRHIRDIENELIEKSRINLLTTAAASYIGAYVCGVKDRHFDNILLRTTDATVFHIDFGYCLGESIKNIFATDTGIFAITKDFYDIVGEQIYEKYFIPLCVDCFLCLRKHAKELIDFTLLSFSYLFKDKQYKKIKEFLEKKLKIKDKEENIRKWLGNEIRKAPKSKKTKLKNKLHRMNAPTLTENELPGGK